VKCPFPPSNKKVSALNDTHLPGRVLGIADLPEDDDELLETETKEAHAVKLAMNTPIYHFAVAPDTGDLLENFAYKGSNAFDTGK